MRPNVLFLTPRFPYPLVGGDVVKAYHLLALLSRSYNVTCVTFAEKGQDTPETRAPLTALGITLQVVPLNRTGAMLRVARTILSDRPLEIQFYRHSSYADAVRRAARTQRFDLVISFFMRTAEYALLVPNVPRILIAEDARIILQERATERARLHPGYVMRSVERRKLSTYEPRIVEQFDLTTFVSESDRQRILRSNPAARTDILSNGVDLDAFSFHADQPTRRGIVFAGKMDVLHNVVMANTIGNEIFPRLRKIFPDLTCTIIGQNPHRSVRALEGNGITVTGHVPSVRDNVIRGAVFLHPQRIGTGIQNKVLEAMALGTAVVTTPIGINGIAAEHRVHAMICSSIDEMVESTAELLRSITMREELTTNARNLMERRHSWESIGAQLEGVIARVCGETIGDGAAVEEIAA